MIHNESEIDIQAKLKERFDVLENLTRSVTLGDIRSLIVSGPPGLGKSYTIEEVLREYINSVSEEASSLNKSVDSSEYTEIVKGYVRTTGLIRLLWKYRHPGCVIVFDDADSIFSDENSLNLLKAACDSIDERKISYMTETEMFDDYDEVIEKTFKFDGSIIFITNINFDREIANNNKMATHYSALISRSHYLDLGMNSQLSYIVRIKMVLKQGLLNKYGFTKEEEEELLNFLIDNQLRLRELSLRMMLKIATIRYSMPDDWQRVARVTCCKGL